jgi:hypothetical protein
MPIDVIPGIGTAPPAVVGIAETNAVAPEEFPRIPVILVRRPGFERERDLALIIHTLDLGCLGFGFRQGWKQHASEDRDNRDHHQQLDQSECRYESIFFHCNDE